jgi:hypothetical protein
MINNTFELRKTHGKFETLESEYTDNKRNHVSNCEACGSSKPERLYGVKSNDGKVILLVGSKCASILTSAKNVKVDSTLANSGEVYNDGSKEVVYITVEWMKTLGDYLFSSGKRINRFGDTIISSYETNYNGAYHTANYNPFLDSVYQQARKNNKISLKQYEAVNKVLSAK